MKSLNSAYAFNARQEGIRNFGEGFLVTIAGPGTGKTYGLIMRVERLLDEETDEKNIVYLTFIREIVDKFSQDLESYFNKKSKGIPNIGINTLHSIAWRILKNLGHNCGLPGHVELIGLDWNNKWSQVLLNDIKFVLERGGLPASKTKLKKMLCNYLKYRRNLLDIEILDDEDKQFCEALKDISSELKMIDWDSVVPFAIEAMEEEELPSWIKNYKHFLVDEYQDLNPAESSFFIKLSSHIESVVIVGDNNQSVYSGRGASPNTLLKLAEDQNKYSLNLVLCKKRPPKKIVIAANNLLKIMACNDYEKVKLIPSKNEGNIRIMEFPSAKKEINYLVSQINKWKQLDSCSKIVGLFPMWNLANAYKKFLDNVGVSCRTRITGNSKKYRAKLVFKLLILKSHPLIERFILSDFTLLNKIYMKGIRKFIQDGKSIKEAVQFYIQTKKCNDDIKKEAEFYLALIDNLNIGELDSALPYICSYVGEDLSKYKETIHDFMHDETEKNLELKCETYLDKIFEPKGNDNDDEKIQLLSMHSSKGLSKKYVFIPACEQRFIPSITIGERRKEMLRLFYIAITRAECEVLITYPRTRDKTRKVRGARYGRGTLSDFAKATGVQVEEI